ncbi:MAG: methionine adenosyltransferase [Myxococcota bacterium]
MNEVVVSSLPIEDSPVEMVERKGLGHPDTICDALAEQLSRNLCRHYLDRFGEVLHHNVDKALLCGGSATPAFGGGAVTAPIEIHLSGRATDRIGDARVPVETIAIEGSRAWLRDALHALDVERDVRLHCGIRPGSQDLSALFARGRTRVPLANDTSFGVGYAPLSPLERLVLGVERRLNGRDRARERPAWGEDVKVMGLRQGRAVRITVACALIGRHLRTLDDYFGEKEAIRRVVSELAVQAGFDGCVVDVNAADSSDGRSIYLTVTGTSAEAGDDGEVGRGNRVNGLITPGRPMSLEAAAGKNPVSHAGKIYNVLAHRVAARLVADLSEVVAAECHLLSRIGHPVTEPALAHLRLKTRDGIPAEALAARAGERLAAELDRLPALLDAFVAGTIDVF